MKNKSKKNGFTLVEMLIVVSILSVILTLGSNLFFSILRGSTKTKIIQSVKQNGDYALTVVELMIRNARKIDPSYSGSSIRIFNLDGGTTIFSCSGGRIASNGASLTSGEVTIADCSNVFSVTPGMTGVKPDVVTINFTISQAGPGSRYEERASINFKSTVSLRNY